MFGFGNSIVGKNYSEVLGSSLPSCPHVKRRVCALKPVVAQSADKIGAGGRFFVVSSGVDQADVSIGFWTSIRNCDAISISSPSANTIECSSVSLSVLATRPASAAQYCWSVGLRSYRSYTLPLPITLNVVAEKVTQMPFGRCLLL